SRVLVKRSAVRDTAWPCDVIVAPLGLCLSKNFTMRFALILGNAADLIVHAARKRRVRPRDLRAIAIGLDARLRSTGGIFTKGADLVGIGIAGVGAIGLKRVNCRLQESGIVI